MRINELFFSLQGEGTESGLPTIFIRTAGCNLRCRWCDTPYARRGGLAMKPRDVLDAVSTFPCRRICLTGGEPLHQVESLDLLCLLKAGRFHVTLETNGSFDIAPALHLARISMDVKCPSSGMTPHMHWPNLSLLRKSDQLKFVIADRGDYEFAREVVRRHRLHSSAQVIFQPLGGRHGRRLARWILADALDVRLGLQLHKIIWGKDVRGR